MNKELEKGKAIIQLAQMFIILSGFLFATGSIAYTNSINSVSSSLNFINQFSLEIIKINRMNLSLSEIDLINQTIDANSRLINTINPQLNLMNTFFLFGGIVAIISFVIWNIGYWKIKKEENNLR